MFRFRANPRFRRLAWTVLVALATILVGAVGIVLFMEEEALDPDAAFPDPVMADPTKRPEFIFPESVRTFDLSLNRFVDRFARVCMEARYADFRLMLSSRTGDPIVARRFESMFNALKQVRILSIEKLPDLPDFENPVYSMLVEYDLEDYAVTRGDPTERRRLALLKEEGAWRIGPIPHDALEKLRAFSNAASRPGAVDGRPAATGGDEPKPDDSPKTAANRPAQLGP